MGVASGLSGGERRVFPQDLGESVLQDGFQLVGSLAPDGPAVPVANKVGGSSEVAGVPCSMTDAQETGEKEKGR